MQLVMENKFQLAEAEYSTCKGTVYVLQNNDAERPVRKLYIEHVADSSHNGYVITTEERCVKSVTGFSRFEFRIEPQETIEFVVNEVANYSTQMTSNIAITNMLVKKEYHPLLSPENLHILKNIIKRNETITALRVIKTERYTDKDYKKWSSFSEVDLEGDKTRTPILSAEMLLQVDAVLKKNAEIEKSEKEISVHKIFERKVLDNQQRLHGHLQNLEKLLSSPLCERYLKDLNKEEDDLADVRSKIDAQEVLQTKLKDELVRLLFVAATGAVKLEQSLELSD